MLFELVIIALISETSTQFADSVFITGSNKGQGLEWVRQLSQLEDPPKVIFAACRHPENETYVSELMTVADQSDKTKIIIVRLDVTNETEIEQAAAAVQGELKDAGLNVLINNAGIYLRSTGNIYATNQMDVMLTLNINSVGPLLVVKHLLPMLKQAGTKWSENGTQSVARAAIINISSKLGSLSSAGINSGYHYAMSKAALNMETVKMGAQFRPLGIMVISLHPGGVFTDLRPFPNGITTEEAISAMLSTVRTFNESHSAGFYERTGERIPW